MCVRMRFVILVRKGIYNIDGSKSALAETDKIYVYTLRSKCGKTPEMMPLKRVQFVILALKGILRTLMVARGRN